MLLLIFFLMCLFAVSGVGILAALSDLRGMVIANHYSVVILGLFAVCYGGLYFAGRADVFAPLLSHGLSFLIVFIVTLLLFAARVMGGGDAKLASALAVWVGIKGMVAFLFYMSVVGGLLGISALVIGRVKPFKAPKAGSWIEQVQNGANKVPYGVAIVAGALASFVKMGYLNVDTLSSFLLG